MKLPIATMTAGFREQDRIQQAKIGISRKPNLKLLQRLNRENKLLELTKWINRRIIDLEFAIDADGKIFCDGIKLDYNRVRSMLHRDFEKNFPNILPSGAIDHLIDTTWKKLVAATHADHI